jgi:hypothetical protein
MYYKIITHDPKNSSKVLSEFFLKKKKRKNSIKAIEE